MDFSQFYLKERILDLVIMNDGLCFHEAIFKDGIIKEAFSVPILEFHPPTEENRMKATVKCPICGKIYPEASKRMKQQIIQFYKDSHGKEV